MKYSVISLLLFSVILLFSHCSKDGDEKDTTYPIIDEAYPKQFPQYCDTLIKGSTYTFEFRFTDNQELGAYSLDIHHNFDHHAHDDHDNHGIDCPEHPDKEAINPWNYDFTEPFPEGQTEAAVSFQVNVPVDIDPGDYHVNVKVVDATGWQSIEPITVKIVDPS